MNTFKALVTREFQENRNGYLFTPLILAGITIALLLLTMMGIGSGAVRIDDVMVDKIDNLSEILELAKAEMAEEGRIHELPYAIAMTYNAISMPAWIAFPFVVFFSLLNGLYEERRDRSILFWKSMPVADWQEVLAKLAVPVLGTPVIFMAVTVAAQLLIAFLLSIVVLFQGGPALDLWPLGAMIDGWFATLIGYLAYSLWALPLFAWVLLVSAYAQRMPFLFVALPPVVLTAVEGIFFDSQRFIYWIGMHLGGWMEKGFANIDDDFDGPFDLHSETSAAAWDALGYSLTAGDMWLGLIVAGVMIFATIELRKKAI